MATSNDNDIKPVFDEISPSNGQAFLKLARKLVISNHPCILELLQGTMPYEMLEFSESVYPNKLGRRAGTYNDESGNPSAVDQTMNEYREYLIQARMSESVSRDEALDLIFPASTKQAREKVRQTINASIQSLMSKLMYLWPKEEIAQLMQLDSELSSATREFDLIRWHHGFLKFCTNASGNSEVNIKKAESKISNLKMKHDGYLDYAAQFKLAADNLKMCKSTFTEERVVALFFENLDQSEDRFFRWYRDFLTVFHPLNQFKGRPLAEAMTVAQQHYDQVIRATAKIERIVKSDQTHRPSGHVMFTATNNSSSIPSKRKPESSAVNHKSSKTRLVEVTKSSVVPLGKAPNGTKTRVMCNAYRIGSCSYGDLCKFLHVKSSK